MSSATNITIKFNNSKAAEKAMEIIQNGLADKEMAAQIFSNGKTDAEMMIDDLRIDYTNNTISAHSFCLMSATYESLLPIIFNALAKDDTVGDFYARTEYESLSSGDCGFQKAERRGNTYRFTSRLSEDATAYCPHWEDEEDAEYIVSYEEYDPNATYICPICGEVLDHNKMFGSSAPIIIDETYEVIENNLYRVW